MPATEVNLTDLNGIPLAALDAATRTMLSVTSPVFRGTEGEFLQFWARDWVRRIRVWIQRVDKRV